MNDGAVAATLSTLLAELAPIGRHPGSGGYRRYAWTAADLGCRDWFTATARARGMAVDEDGNGNLWAWWGTPAPGAVVTGSHLDSVPDGGAYDGPLGVVSGFAAVDVLRTRGVRPARPLAVVSFTEEEGARFGVACLGSRLLTGRLDGDTARGLRDTDGVTLAEAMAAAGRRTDQLGHDEDRLARVGAFVELHVEQGRGLVEVGAPVGVGRRIWPHGRWRLEFHGSADHAGTTHLADRADPMLPLAHTVLAARAVALRSGALATVGRLDVSPNATNAVPAVARAWLDARAPDDDLLREVVTEVTRQARAAADPHAVRVVDTCESLSPATSFTGPLQDRVCAVLGTAPLLDTGAGHDAGVLAGHVPSVMLFVRNPSGVSHAPDEQAEPADCVAGVLALAHVLEDLVTR
ncbi:MAG: allantoate amidohydrolase [Actinomycetota bacterium]